jgi:hypothetical protein
MPVCLVFAAELGGKCGIGNQPPQDAAPIVANRLSALIPAKGSPEPFLQELERQHQAIELLRLF